MKRLLLVAAAGLVLVPPVAALGDSNDTRIQVADTGLVVSGQPFDVSIKISDPDGVDTARLYFKSPGTETFSFISLAPQDGVYTGKLPAPSSGTHRIDQLVLVKDGAGHLSQSRFFRTQVRASDTTDEASLKQPVDVYSELSPLPETVDGFTGNITVKPVEPGLKYGVVAGLISDTAAGTDTAEGDISEKVSSNANTIKYNNVVLGIAGAAVAVAVLAAGSSGDSSSSASGSGSLQDALNSAINDEYKARATYRAVLARFGDIIPFRSIANAEEQHIDSLEGLYSKYRYPVPSDTWGSRVSAGSTVLESCQIGVDAEIANANLYDGLLAATREYDDVQAVFSQLQSASRNIHLPAFQRCVDRERG